MVEEVRTESAPIRTTTVDESVLEAEQPLLMPGEVAANLTARDADVTEEMMEMGVENPTERVNEATDGTPRKRKVLTAIDEEERVKRTTPRDEAARPSAATMHIYQRRPAREEASRKKSTEEQPKGTPGKKAVGGEERPAKSVVEPPRRRRRLLLNEEPEEAEEDIVFTLIEALPSSGQPAHLLKWRKPREKIGKGKGRGKSSLPR